MDRRAGLIAGALAVAACGPPVPASPGGAPVTVVARGTLAYAVAFAGERLVSVELTERFELVIRDGATGDGRRVDLGPAERDWPALAVDGGRAWVGGDSGVVVAIDLDAATAGARWPIGAPVTALAAAGEVVAIGDAEGVLCVRRAADGALLQCLEAHATAIAGITVDGDRLITRATDGEAAGWQLPALRRVEAVAAPPRWGDGALVIDGPRVDVERDGRRERVVTMAGEVRAVAVAADGRLAVASWIARLDQPSIVLIGWPR
jgi:hypothetical protein